MKNKTSKARGEKEIMEEEKKNQKTMDGDHDVSSSMYIYVGGGGWDINSSIAQG